MLQKFAIFPAKQLAISKQVTPLLRTQEVRCLITKPLGDITVE